MYTFSIGQDINEFARFYVQLFIEWWHNFCAFWVSIGQAFAKAFGTDIVGYFKTTGSYIDNFGFLAWLLLIIMSIITLTFVIFLIIKISQLLRRFFRFRRVEIEKDQLLSEIAELNQQVKQLDLEKKNILGLKVGNLATGTDVGILTGNLVDVNDFNKLDERNATNQVDATTSTEPELVEDDGKRFTKLIAIDEKYKDMPLSIQMAPEDMLSLRGIVDRFINFAASQMHLYYSKDVISRFFAGMATGKLIILEGISGTGKTSLPYAMSKFFNNNASIVPVQPSWRDKSEIIGYLNEFTKKFNETDFLKSLYEVTYREDVNYIVLDEMNLARIEYYFAEFLSMMEMPDVSEWKIDLVPSTYPDDPKHLQNGKLLVPQNVWFIGTANKDDSTFTITDKVYDRATTIILNSKANYFDAPFTETLNMSYDYLNELFKKAHEVYSITPKTMESFKKLDDFIQDNFKIAFGNRIMRQIHDFVPVYMACGFDELEGLDYMFATKILRKFESLNIAFLKNEIDQLIALIQKLYGKDSFKDSINYLRQLQKMN